MDVWMGCLVSRWVDGLMGGLLKDGWMSEWWMDECTGCSVSRGLQEISVSLGDVVYYLR